MRRVLVGAAALLALLPVQAAEAAWQWPAATGAASAGAATLAPPSVPILVQPVACNGGRTKATPRFTFNASASTFAHATGYQLLISTSGVTGSYTATGAAGASPLQTANNEVSTTTTGNPNAWVKVRVRSVSGTWTALSGATPLAIAPAACQ